MEKLPHIRYLVFATFLYANAVAQNAATIVGHVTAAGSGESLIGANVSLIGTFYGAATDSEGNFLIKELPPGSYTLLVSMIGYRNVTVDSIIVRAGETLVQEVTMDRDVLKSPQIVVSAARFEQDIMEAPISVSVLGVRQIFDKAAFSLEEVVIDESGVTSVKGQLNIRGASGYTLGAGSRSLLLLDGVPLLGSAAGNIVWTVVPSSEIERVEIMKSAGSALYGSSAMGGVLNIITRNASASPENKLRIRLGRYSQPRFDQWRWRNDPGLVYTVEATHARPFGDHSGWLRLQRNSTPGFTELNWLNAWNLTGKLKLNFGSRYTAVLYANYYSENKGLESVWKSPAEPFEAPAICADDKSVGQKFNLNGFGNYIYSPRVVVKAKAAWYDVWWRNHGTNTDFSREQKYFSELQGAANWSSTLSTKAGVALERGWINARIFGVHNSTMVAAYLHARQKVGHWLVSLGARNEQYYVDGEYLDGALAPSLAVNWRRYDWLSLRSSVGGGFRVPTIAEMFSHSQLNVFKVEPNPDLKTEASVSFEAGGTMILSGLVFDQVRLDGAVFVNRFNQIIEPVPDNLGIIHFENITDARIAGQELSLSAVLPAERGLIKVAYTHLDPVILSLAGNVIDTLSYRYRHNLQNTLTLNFGAVAATVEYRYASRLEKTELFDTNPLTGQDRRVPLHLVNSGLAWNAGEWEVLLRIENLFQYYYVELERNMAAERLITFCLFYTF
ncbi:MAG: TonB-dependent receptor [Fidelibacterota bacterium]|nr:MAG: TonB-dependent receptor [Candidatus Neomarinimicrobiota bacterium]